MCARARHGISVARIRSISYLDDVMIHGTAEGVVDQIKSLASDIGMTYLMAAPLSGRSFQLLTDKVLPHIAG
jgi:hypothetical protein